MKKVFIGVRKLLKTRVFKFSLILMLAGVIPGPNPVFAEDAIMLPARAGRISLVPVYGFTTGSFDKNWKKQDADKTQGGDMQMIPLGAALEYGINNWITAAVQWAPGYNVWSKFKDLDNANVNGFYDIFAGAKVQIIGEKAPLVTESMRFALAAGAKIPLPGLDVEGQNANALKNEPFTAANVDKHVLGIGSRFYLDFNVNKYFFINFYGSFTYYPIKATEKEMGVGLGTSKIYDHGYELNFEIEPRYILPGEGITLNFGLPFSYDIAPKLKVNNTSVQDTDVNLLSVRPGLSIMMTGIPLPLELKMEYKLPLMGKNTSAGHAAILGIKVYFKI